MDIQRNFEGQEMGRGGYGPERERGSLWVWGVPIPDDPALKRAYLDLGWFEMSNGERLKWSFAKGSPVHPGRDEQQ